MKYKKSLSAILVIFALSYSVVKAAGLGYLQVKSTLDKPLIAEIQIFGDTEPNISAELASPDEYSAQNLEYSHNLDSAIVKIIKLNNKNIIRITTLNNFNEPTLVLLVKLKFNNQTIQKSYIKFIELTPQTAVNTAKLIDTSFNPASDLLSSTTDLDIPHEYTSRSRGTRNEVQYTRNKALTNDNDLIEQSDNNSIEHAGTIYVEKKSSDKIHIKDNQNTAKKAVNKKIQIDIEKSIKLDNIPLSSGKSLPLNNEKEVKNSAKTNPENTKKNNINTSVKEKNQPTLKLDNLSADDIKNASSVASQLQANESMLSGGIGVNASNISIPASSNVSEVLAVSGVQANSSNTSMTAASMNTASTTNNTASTTNNSKLMDNKAYSKHQNNIGIFEAINLEIQHSIKQTWFYITLFILLLLVSAVIYIIYMKQQFKRNLKHKEEELNIIKQQINLFNQKETQEKSSDIEVNNLLNNPEEVEKKRKRKRNFF